MGRAVTADKLREECGVFGIHGNDEAAAHTVLGLHALQHRGQEAAGVVTFDGRLFHSHRALGLVGDHFSNEAVIAALPGHAAIGHVRYSTAGAPVLRNVQPLFVDFAFGGLAYWLPSYLDRVKGFGSERAALVVGISGGLAAIVGMSLGGWLSDRLSRTNPRALFLVPGTAMLLSVPFVLLLPVVTGTAEMVRRAVADWNVPAAILSAPGDKRAGLGAADAALTISGTSTLELAVAGLPMVVTYRASAVSAFVARRLINVPFVALPNLILGRAVVPELLQDECTPDSLARALDDVRAALRFLRIDDERLYLSPSAEDLEAIAHRGFVRTAAEKLRAIADDPDAPEREIAARALLRLYAEHRKLVAS